MKLSKAYTRLVVGCFRWLLALTLWAALGLRPSMAFQETHAWQPYQVQPGDTWSALAWRFGLTLTELRAPNPYPNRQVEPAIGSEVWIPAGNLAEQKGRLLRLSKGGLLELSARLGANPWSLAQLNAMVSPYRPGLHRLLFIPGGDDLPREFPIGFQSLELAPFPVAPGQAIAFRGRWDEEKQVEAWLDTLKFSSFANGQQVVGLLGTGAFFSPGVYELRIASPGQPLWSQPLTVVPGEWGFQDITLTGPAAAIDQESIRLERERLTAIWTKQTGSPQWEGAFQLPIRDYLELTSAYGVRRSYNGGPYRTYHEGVDFSAYGGTPVYAPADGTVVLAEFLYVRGGAIIIDHGFGLFTGLYHLSEIVVQSGQQIAAGQQVGAVGTTGLSTGNHLHWDLLVEGVWVDAAAWISSGLGCWILEGWGQACLT